jgi:hypothetical protein
MRWPLAQPMSRNVPSRSIASAIGRRAVLPARLVAAEARLRSRIVAFQVRGAEDRGHSGEPLLVVDLAALVCDVELGRSAPTARAR